MNGLRLFRLGGDVLLVVILDLVADPDKLRGLAPAR